MSSTPEERDQLDQLQKAALALKRMRSRIEALERARTEPIAIIGMGCRFPGAAGNVCGPEDFWRLLHAGEDAIREVPPDRWDLDAYYDPNPDVPGKMYTRWGGFLRDIDRFDTQLFGIAPREATSIDPQQRLLLEVSWEALEHAGQTPDGLKKTQTGIFIGIGIGDYSTIQMSPDNIAGIDAYTGTGSGFCFASGRLSYVLGTQGPSLSIDTACSSSLVAIHLACQSLRAQECRIALAGGVNAMLTPTVMLFLAKTRALSPTGRCRTFDAAADGFVRGEGCGVLVLKRLDDAIADSDTVLAVICGSAINHDGPSSGLTVPNGHAQQSLLRQVLEQAQVAPAHVDYVEAHGTGTSLGDPIELQALSAVMGVGRAKDRPLLVGSLKTNIGHLEAAAGVAGVIKVVLALQHGEIPPHLHFRDPTPHLPWEALPVAIPTTLTPWPAQAKRRVAGVSSFGLSGTNAHVLLAEAPPREAEQEKDPAPLHVLALSAKSEPALRALATRYERHLAAHPSLSPADVCFTANTGRAYLSHHLAAVAGSSDQMRARLADFGAGRESSGLISGRTREQRPKIAFLYTGQGSQYAGMGRQLYETQPVFRQALDRCDAIARPYLGLDLREVLYPNQEGTGDRGQGTTPLPPPAGGGNEGGVETGRQGGSVPNTQHPTPDTLDQTWLTQPVLFALEYALAELWRSWGIVPAGVLGHSVGEYAAACVAGVFSLEDGLRLILERARLMQALPPGGAMLTVFAEEEQVRAAIRPHLDDLAIAALNGPRHVVISGRGETLEAVAAQFRAEEIKTKQLTVSHAFHSPLMRPMLDDFARVARAVCYTAPRLDVIANLTGDVAGMEIATPEYWIEHVLQPVRFAAGVQTLQRRGYDICVEIGPRPVLLGMARHCLPDDGDQAPWLWLPSLRPNKKADGEQMLESLAALYANGVRVDWRGFYQDRSHRKISLPTYPFQQQRYWAAPAGAASQAPTRGAATQRETGPLSVRRIYSPAFTRGEVQFETRLDRRTAELLHDEASHKLTLPAPASITLALAAGADALRSEQVTLEDISIMRGLTFSEDDTRTLHILLNPTTTPAYTFQVLSLSDEEGQPAPSWTCHATGTLRLANAATLAPQDSLAALQIALTEEVAPIGQPEQDGAALIEKVRRRDMEVLFQVALLGTPSGDSAPYRLHPLLLDACCQGIGAALGAGHDGERYTLPRVERLSSFGRSGARIWCHARAHAAPGDDRQINADVQLFDETGVQVAEIGGLCLRPATWDALDDGERPEWERWLYQVTWQPAAPQRVASQLAGRAWLVLADSGGIGRGLAGLLRAQGAHCTVVYAGTSFARTATNEYVVDPAMPSDFEQLIKEWVGLDGVPLAGVVHLWSLEAPFSPDMSAESLQHAQIGSCASTLHLAQALTRAGGSLMPRLWLVTRESQPVDRPGTSHPQQAPLWGLGQVIALEHPELRCVCLDLHAAARPDDARILLEELSAPDDEQRVAYREGARYVSRLARYRPAEYDWADSAGQMPIRADGSYLITGGLGALGLAVARWMVEQGAGAVVLQGRRAGSARARAEVTALEQTGARILVAQVDVADAGALSALLEQIGSTLPPLRGIVHAAGILQDATLGQQTWERFCRVMSPKIAGAWNLHTLTRAIPLDFFVCFSSIASTFGSPGQGNYAAANAFLDGLAHYRRGLGLPATTINWGPWAGAGMDADNYGRRAAQGLEMITSKDGVQALGRLMADGAAQVCVLPVSWEQFLRQLLPPGHRAFFEAFGTQIAAVVPTPEPQLREQLAAVPASERRAWLSAQIRTLIAQVLGAESPEQIAPREGLFEQGIDSLMALEVKNRLEMRIGCLLRQTFVFDYPMVDAMVDYLSKNVFSELFRPQSNEARAADLLAAATVMDLAQLTEEEAEALLIKELEQINH